METPAPLIGITPDDLDARIERAVSRALDRAPHRRDGRTADAHRPEGEGWLTVREALAYTRLSKPTLQRYRAAGRVRFAKLGSNVYFRRDWLDALLEGGVATTP